MAEFSPWVRWFEQNRLTHDRESFAYLDAGIIDGHWTDTVFVHVRRILGLRTELMVLTIAEVIALTYYGAFADRCPDPVVAAVASSILADERRHVQFHLDRLSPVSAPVRALWWVMAGGSAVVVALDHRRLLHSLNYPPHRFVRDVLRGFAGVSAAAG
jgi:hypothetical protein